MNTSQRSVVLAFVAALFLTTIPSVAHSGEKRPVIFEPVPSQITRSYFANGEPFALVTTDSAVAMLVMDPATLNGYKYIRLWCLYYNNSSQTILLDPSSIAKLVSTSISKGESQELMPEPPSDILKAVSNEMANKEILQAIGGALAAVGQSMTVRPTTITGGGSAAGATWTVNDVGEKQRAVSGESARRTAAAMERTRTAYDLYSASVNAGILRRNSVFPGCSVNGYIYFPSTKKYNGRFAEYSHVLALQLPHEKIKVAFNPAPGE